jgi:hypothetical protein
VVSDIGAGLEVAGVDELRVVELFFMADPYIFALEFYGAREISALILAGGRVGQLCG